MWFQHLAWNHVCMISYLNCLVFKEHCFLTSFIKSLSDFCKLSVWVSFYIIPHSVPFVKNFFEIFFIASFKATSASVQLQGFALLYLSDNDVYSTTNLHLCQHFFYFIHIFFRNTACGHNDFCSVRLNGPNWWFILTHRYRLSLSQFTETVMIESAIVATFAAQKQESPDAKVSCPSGCCRIILPLLYLIATSEIV